jgi:hypothetical protein
MTKAILLAIALLLGGADSSSGWKVTDTTDNDTGLRSVDALDLAADSKEFVMLWMRCHDRQPGLYLSWSGARFLSRTVVTVAAADSSDAEPRARDFIFEETGDPVDGPLRAGDPVGLVTHIAQAPHAVLTIHAEPADRSVGMDVRQTTDTWKRVSQWCPARPSK